METEKDEGVLSLANLAGGAAVEAFDIQLEKVLENILDPNTNPTAVREVTLKVKIKPDENRAFGPMEFTCKPKFGDDKPITTMVHIGRKGSKAIASEHDARQLSFPSGEEKQPTPLHAVGGAEKE